jgi:hypothetical protein
VYGALGTVRLPFLSTPVSSPQHRGANDALVGIGAHRPKLWRRLALEAMRGRARTNRWQRSRGSDPLAPFVLGKGFEAALPAAISDSHRFHMCWLCQAHFCIGASRLMAGDATGYREQLAQAAAQEGASIAVPEYHLVRSELSLLP